MPISTLYFAGIHCQSSSWNHQSSDGLNEVATLSQRIEPLPTNHAAADEEIGEMDIGSLQNAYYAVMEKLRAEIRAEKRLRMEAQDALAKEGAMISMMDAERHCRTEEVQKALAEREGSRKLRIEDDLKIETLSEKVCLLSGEAWATMQQLSSRKQSTELTEDQLKHGCSWFKDFWPTDGSLPLTSTNELQRSSHRDFFKTDIFGNTPTPAEEVCHLCPHSASCNHYWDPVLWYLSGKTCFDRSAEQKLQLEMFKNGFRDNNQFQSKVENSAMTDALENHIMMRSQYLLDKILIIPLTTMNQARDWKGEAYDFVCIPLERDMFEIIGALRKVGKMEKHSIPSTDQRVKDGFESLAHWFGFLVHCMKGTELNEEQACGTKRNFANVLKFIKGRKEISVPKLPAKEVMFRFGSFSRGMCHESGGRVKAERLTGHPAPHPLLLLCRSINTWFTLLSFEQSGGDATFIDLDLMTSVLGKRCSAESIPHCFDKVAMSASVVSNDSCCVLLPTCTDVSDFSSCMLCYSKDICKHPWQYSVVEDEDDYEEKMEAVDRVRSSMHTAADLHVVHSIVLCCAQCEESFDDSSSESDDHKGEPVPERQPTFPCKSKADVKSVFDQEVLQVEPKMILGAGTWSQVRSNSPAHPSTDTKFPDLNTGRFFRRSQQYYLYRLELFFLMLSFVLSSRPG
jgi:hypothetical protein